MQSTTTMTHFDTKELSAAGTTRAAATVVVTAAPAFEITFKQASALRKGGHLMIKGHPCKITDMSTHKSGKHGGAKCNFIGVGTVDGKKRECQFGSKVDVEVPQFAVEKKSGKGDATEVIKTSKEDKTIAKAEKKAASAARRAARIARKAQETAGAGAGADTMGMTAMVMTEEMETVAISG
jgi:hypothetical protein